LLIITCIWTVQFSLICKIINTHRWFSCNFHFTEQWSAAETK